MTGDIITLPCEVGTEVWLTHWWEYFDRRSGLRPRCVQYFRIDRDNIYAHFGDGCIPISEFGKTAFLTKKEAQAALDTEIACKEATIDFLKSLGVEE